MKRYALKSKPDGTGYWTKLRRELDGYVIHCDAAPLDCTDDYCDALFSDRPIANDDAEVTSKLMGW